MSNIELTEKQLKKREYNRKYRNKLKNDQSEISECDVVKPKVVIKEDPPKKVENIKHVRTNTNDTIIERLAEEIDAEEEDVPTMISDEEFEMLIERRARQKYEQYLNENKTESKQAESKTHGEESFFFQMMKQMGMQAGMMAIPIMMKLMISRLGTSSQRTIQAPRPNMQMNSKPSTLPAETPMQPLNIPCANLY